MPLNVCDVIWSSGLKGSLSCALNPLRAVSLSCAPTPLLALSLSLSLSLSLASAIFREHTQVQVGLLALHLIKVLKNTEYIYTTKVIKEIINEYKIRERKNSWQYL